MKKTNIDATNDIEMKKNIKSDSLYANKRAIKNGEEKKSKEWSQDIINLAGSWGGDFPSLEEIRATT